MILFASIIPTNNILTKCFLTQNQSISVSITDTIKKQFYNLYKFTQSEIFFIGNIKYYFYR